MKNMRNKLKAVANALSRKVRVVPDTSWPTEICARFASFDAWRSFYRGHPFINDAQYLEALAGEIAREGFLCPFHGHKVAPSDILVGAPNYREGLAHGSLNSRLRAVLLELQRAIGGRPSHLVRIYAPEAVTDFALLLRGRFARFIGSEYTTDPEIRAKLFPVPHENLLDLSFPEGAFDIVVVNDVFEHVPSIDRCLSEIARVLRPGGRLVSTFPFNIGGEHSVVKARLTDAGVEYLTDPEYHGNPVDPKGSLVFEIPGWDILERTRAQGFADAEIVYESSVRHGVLGGGFSGIFTLVAVR